MDIFLQEFFRCKCIQSLNATPINSQQYHGKGDIFKLLHLSTTYNMNMYVHAGINIFKLVYLYM